MEVERAGVVHEAAVELTMADMISEPQRSRVSVTVTGRSARG